jgi:hypothetical protein
MPFPAPAKVEASKLFSSDDLERLEAFIKDNVKSINSKLESYRSKKLPEYVRLYKGKPKNDEVDFPWPGAANLIIQLIGTFCDELLSRVMAIYMYDPLWKIEISGDNSDQTGEDQRKILEKFLMDEAYDPSSLNLYPVEQAWFNSAIKYGNGIMEFPWEYDVEQIYNFTGGGTSDEAEVQFEFKDVVKRDGPHPRLVPLNKFGIDPSITNLCDANFFYTIETLDYWQVEDLSHRSKLYADLDDKVLEEILDNPDRTEADEMQREVLQALSMSNGDDFRGNREYDFYTCYLKFQIGSKRYSLISRYHHKTKKVLFTIFNFYPENAFPVEDVKLTQDEESYFVQGYAQMLRSYQKEVSQNSNWRTNNRNMAMLGVWRVDPGSKLSSVLQMYPGVMAPAKDGEIELIKAGSDVGTNPADDQFICALAKERAGIDPSIGGTGGGLVNNKRGIYSASGTSMVLIQQNNRNNLRMSDMRSGHVRIGIKLLNMWSTFGVGDKIRKYGDKAETLKDALIAYTKKQLGFRLRPTTASNNKELDRQNDILLSGKLDASGQMIAQIVQALGMNKGAMYTEQPALAKYYEDYITAIVALDRTIAGNFNHPDMDKLVAMVDFDLLKPKQSGGAAGGASGQPGGAGPGAGLNQGTIPTGGVQTSGAIPQ